MQFSVPDFIWGLINYGAFIGIIYLIYRYAKKKKAESNS
jgi:cbb3-type cytochrome oxidase subunit 3